MDGFLAALTGDVAFEVGPGAGAMPVGGAILIGVSDAAAVQRTLDGLADLMLVASASRGRSRPRRAASPGGRAASRGFPAAFEARWRTSTYQDTTIRYLDDSSISSTGFLPAYAVVDGAAIIGSSPDEVRKVIDVKNGALSNITASSAYTEAVAGCRRRGDPVRRRGGDDVDGSPIPPAWP